jgi:hypothetical protein
MQMRGPQELVGAFVALYGLEMILDAIHVSGVGIPVQAFSSIGSEC